MDSVKKIVLSGYYGFDNIGDEAVLYGIISAIKQQIEDVEITVLSNDPAKTQAIYGVHAMNRWDMKRIAQKIKESDLLISGGGSLLQDVTSNKTIPYYLAIIKMAKFYKKPVVFYSQGVGPIHKKWNRWLVKNTVNKVDAIFVRDSGSKELLETIGVKKPIQIAADPVLGLELDKKTEEKIRKCLKGEKRVGVYIRPWDNQDRWLEPIKKALQYLILQGYMPYLIPMYYQQDNMLTRTLYDQLNHQAVLIDRPLTIQEVLAYTSECEFIIGMRLHSLIMAATTNTPMIALSYDPKVFDFMNDMGISYCVSTQEITRDNFMEKIKALVEDLDKQKQYIRQAYLTKKEEVYAPIQAIKELL